MPQLQEFVNAQSLLLFKLLNWNKEEFNIFKEPLDRLSPNWFKINYFQGSFQVASLQEVQKLLCLFEWRQGGGNYTNDTSERHHREVTGENSYALNY